MTSQADRTRVAGTGDTTGVPRGATRPHPDAAVDPRPGAAAGPRTATPARRRRLAVAGFAALAAALVAVGVAVAVPLLGTQADPAVPSAANGRASDWLGFRLQTYSNIFAAPS